MMQHFPLHVVSTSVRDANYKPCREDVRREAKRRLNASGYMRHRARALATGTSIPRAMQLYAADLAAAAESLATLRPIPDDFRSDSYWPVPDAPH